MDKRTEELRALANVLLVIGIVGIVICCIVPNTPASYIGIILVGIGFIGAISFDSLAQIRFNDQMMKDEHRQKCRSKNDYLREAGYTFKSYVSDNGCTMVEFIQMYDERDWKLNEVYAHYKHCAGNGTIQSKQQVKRIIDQQRRVRNETA